MNKQLKENSFEQWLRDYHAFEVAESVLDDDMPDHFEGWLSNDLSPDDWIKLVELWSKQLLTTQVETGEVLEKERKRIQREFGDLKLPQVDGKSFISPLIEVMAVVRQTTTALSDGLDNILNLTNPTNKEEEK